MTVYCYFAQSSTTHSTEYADDDDGIQTSEFIGIKELYLCC